jgi:DivIVA domain-containing protein
MTMTSSPESATPAVPEPARALFPVTRGRVKGYERAAVDSFLSHARDAFEAPGHPSMTSGQIRAAAFPLARRGYEITSVDAALTRIEDAFARRERDAAIARVGTDVWIARTRRDAQTVLDRLQRPSRRRFQRTGALRYGYRIDEVDFVMNKLARYLETGSGATIDQVRGVAFRMQRGGYREVQVDAVLDAVVEIMLAVE